MVKEVKVVEREGARVEVTVVQHPDGKTSEIEIKREDTAENRAELEGSVLPDGDNRTPGIDGEAEKD